MKTRMILILALSMSAASASAQFNTVSSHKALYSVEAIADSLKAGRNGHIRQMVPTRHREDTIDKKKEWTDRYMSVSYPLRKIEITSDYGDRADPFTGKRSWHNGLDLRASQGDEAYAMMFGQVIRLGSDKRSGNYVTLRHGDFTVSYCHLSEVLVKKGDCVRPGDVVGISGSTGRSTGPHLHLTVRMGRRHVNPGVLLQFIDETRRQALGMLSGYSL